MEKVLTALTLAAPKALSLYEVMAATGLGGWDAGEDLMRLARAGQATRVVIGGANCYRAI